MLCILYFRILVCETGFYGDSCQLPCNSCRDLKCHHVTGQCIDNCQPGWKNLPFCDQSKYISNFSTFEEKVLYGLEIIENKRI